MKRWVSFIVALLLISLGTACASGSNAVAHDPLEPMNRRVSQFNDAVDTAFAKPLANIYVAVTPEAARTGVNNFFANLGDAWSAVNAVLQAKPKAALDNSLRFVINSTVGIGGLFDVATPIGLERSKKDFGQTLGVWGVGAGPYVVLPLLGPSSLRDTAGTVVDFQGDLARHHAQEKVRTSLSVTKIVNLRANLLSAERLVDGASLDKYSFIRDAYLQLRQRRIENAQEPEDWSVPEQTVSLSPDNGVNATAADSARSQ